MKYCVPFKNSYTLAKECDQYNIKYKDNWEALFSFLCDIDKRVNVTGYSGGISDDQLRLIKRLAPDTHFVLLKDAPNTPYIIGSLKKAEIPFYFADILTSWTMIWDVLNQYPGVTDMYIGGELGFELDEVNTFLHGKDIEIRVVVNDISTDCQSIPFYKSFFIRPEDIGLYDRHRYFDVAEFNGEKDRQETLYRIYAKDASWMGDLSVLVTGFEPQMDNTFIDNAFPWKRARCRRMCLKGGRCRICDNVIRLSETLEKENLVPKRGS